MAHTKIKERLKDVSQKEKDIAQEKLYQLCAEHNLSQIKLDKGSAPWRELVYRIIGLPIDKINAPGRPGLLDQEEKDNFVRYMDIVNEFPILDEEGNEIFSKWSIRERVERYSNKRPISNRASKETNRFFKGTKAYLNYWKNFGRKRIKELEEEWEKEKDNYDGR